MSARLEIATQAAIIGVHMLWERVSRMRPKSPPAIPPSFDAITPAWLTGALCARHPGAQVTGFALEGGSSGSSVRQMIRLDYNTAGRDAGLPPRVFVKATCTFTTRMGTGLARAMQKEAIFYNTVRNELDIEAPRALFGGFELPSQRSMVIFEPMTDCTFTDPTHYINRAEAEDMVQLLARLHATYWNSPRLVQEFRFLDTSHSYMKRVDDLLSFFQRCDIGVERARGVIPASVLARAGEINPATRRAHELNLLGAQTFLHHDVHIGNWYKTAAGRMGLGDWQCLVRGNWASDFSYAITSALTVADRRAWERDLLSLYLDRLRAAGLQDAPDFDAAWRLYRQQIFHALSFWTFTIGVAPWQPDMQPDDFSRINIERFAAAVEDLDALDSLR